jgi:hypothetical protein
VTPRKPFTEKLFWPSAPSPYRLVEKNAKEIAYQKNLQGY